MGTEDDFEQAAEFLLESEVMTNDERQWHLDKKVILGLIFGFMSIAVGGVGQTIYVTNLITTWKTMTDDRIATLEKSDSGQQSHENRIVILEQKFDFIRGDLAEIKDLLRRQVPKSP